MFRRVKDNPLNMRFPFRDASQPMNLANSIILVNFYNRGENISQYRQKDQHFKMNYGN
jgi:hypothetical protein